MGRTTSYSYLNNYIFPVFNLFTKNISDDLSTSNKMALLNKVVYPTGSETVYSYENRPVTRDVGTGSVSQGYRIISREDQLINGGVSTSFNRKNFEYPTDIGKVYCTQVEYGYIKSCGDVSSTTVIKDGLVTRTFENLKHYETINGGALARLPYEYYYNTRITEQDGDLRKVTEYTYDKERNFPNPIKTNIQTLTTTKASTPVSVSATFDKFGNVLTETDPYQNITTYTYDANGKLSTILKPINSTLKSYTTFNRNQQGSVTELSVKENDQDGLQLLKLNNSYDTFGNLVSATATDGTNTSTVNKIYSTNAPYNSAFMTQQTIQATDADGITTPVTQTIDYEVLQGT